MIDRWAKESQPTARSVEDWERAVRELTQITGDVSASAVTKAHMVAFKDKLVDAGRAPKTVRKYITCIGTLLRYAKRNGLVQENVAEGVVVKNGKVGKKPRLPYSDADLQAIFASPVYTAGQRPTAGAGEAAYWPPVLALYTGARLEELGQLHTADVKTDDGIPYLDIQAEEGEDKTLKTESSRRRVPIHPELQCLGFLEYVEARRAVRDTRVFPKLKQDRYDKWTVSWSRWWGRYARDVAGIEDRRKVFHSFRHSFKSACRRAGIEEETHDALTGHTGGGIGRDYGDYPLQPLREALARLQYAVSIPSGWVVEADELGGTRADNRA